MTTTPDETKPTEAVTAEVSPHDSMAAATARRYGTPDMIRIEQLPVPTPKDGEVLVRVETSSLNALDWHFLTGTPYLLRLTNGLRRPKRVIPGADFAGVVISAAADVTDFEPGDWVFGETAGGGCSRYITAKAEVIAAIPEGVSFEAAGATPVAGLTALQALRTHAKLCDGERVLINGAAGGVGTFAVQIAKALGAHVTAVCSTSKVDMVRALGADRVIDYSKENFTELDERFDVIMDNVGNHTTADCLKVMTTDARYVLISGPKENKWLDPMRKVLGSAIVLWRKPQSFHQFVASPNREDLDYLGSLLASRAVVPEVDRVVGLEGVAAGIAEIGTGHARSKIVVVPTSPEQRARR